MSFVDVDWGKRTNSGKFVTWFYILLGNTMNSWKSKKKIVLRSTSESEYHVITLVK